MKYVCLFKTSIETSSSFNTEQDSFKNIRQATVFYNVMSQNCPKFHISSDWQEIVKIILSTE